MENKVTVYSGFESLPASYEALFNKAATESGFFFSLPWFLNLQQHALSEQCLRIYAVEANQENDDIHLMLPLMHSKSVQGFFSLRSLGACANFYTSLFGPVSGQRDLHFQENLGLLASAIAAEVPVWDQIVLQPLAVDEPRFDLVANAFRQAGFAVQPYFCFGNWYLDVKDRSYQEYFVTLPSKMKNTLARKSRHLARSHQWNIKIFSSQDQVPTAIAAFQQVYQSSWKSAEVFPQFISGLISMCAQQGWLRLGVAYIDGQPAAAQIWIVSHRIAAIYKLAYDEKYAAFSIGSILTAHLMQHVMDIDRVSEVDYLTGDDAYKQDWMSHRRERWGVVAFNLRTLRGRMAALRHIGGRELKNFLRQIPFLAIRRNRV